MREKQGIETKTGHGKSMVSPGSISAYMQLKARMREKQLREKHNDGSQQQSIVQKSHQGGSTKSLGSHLQQEPFDIDFEKDYDYIMDSNECDRNDMDGEDVEFGYNGDLLDMRNESLINQEIENERSDAITLFFVIVLKLLDLYAISLVVLFYNLCMLLCSTFKREANYRTNNVQRCA